jgi:hypothetical protein
METKPIHKCLKCDKSYKSLNTLNKHMLSCVANKTTTNQTKDRTNKNKILKNNIQVTDTSDNMNGTDTSSQSDPQSDEDDNSNEKTKNNYDVSMTFLEGQRVKVEMKKQANEGEEDGEQILKEILKPKISESYQDEIDKLSGLINMVTEFVIPSKEPDKDKMIDQLKNTMMVCMIQARNLIKEMKKMTYRNNYLKNNVMLAAFVLDRCRKDVPETEEEFEELFTS